MQEIPKLDLAWEAVNALGGYVAPGDLEGSGFSYGIEKALEAIESLGGKDPAAQRAIAERENRHCREVFAENVKFGGMP